MFSQVKSTQDRSEGGLGIGLALAKGLVQLHDGTIEARSAGTGRGSEFIVRLPFAANHGDARRKLGRHGPRARTSRRACTRRGRQSRRRRQPGDAVAMEGHEVDVVYDGKEALAAFERTRPDVALLDIGMPEMNGYEVARRMRANPLGRAVTLVAVTGWGQDSDKAQAIAAGFNHHFTKPVEPERILALLDAR